MCEHMRFLGDRDVLRAFDDTKRSLAVWFGGGGTRNVFNAGAAARFAQSRLHTSPSITLIGGDSSGAAIAGYFRAGIDCDHVKVFSEDLTNPHFFDMTRILKGEDPLNIPYLQSVFDGATGRGMNVGAARSHHARDVVVLADAKTGQSIMLDQHKAKDYTKIRSIACAVPALARPAILNGRLVCDGGMTKQMLAVDWIMKQPNPPTDILIFLGNTDVSAWHPKLLLQRGIERCLFSRFNRSVPRALAKLTLARHSLFPRLLKKTLTRTDVRVGIMVLAKTSNMLGHSKRESNQLAFAGYNGADALLSRYGL